MLCGAALVQQLEAETHLLSILDCSYWSSGFDVLFAMKFDVDQQAARETLREGIERLHASGVVATGHYSTGNAIDQITSLADSLKVDLIVIGHHPRGLFGRW